VTASEITVGADRFDAIVDGAHDAPTVFLLHGWPQTPDCWESVALGLVDSGRRVIAPAQRGYSAGARPSSARAYRIDNLVNDVVGMADAVGVERFDVVGHDWGGLVAWALAASHPTRVRTLTSLSVPHPAALVRALPRSLQALRSAYVPVFALVEPTASLLLAFGGAPLRSLLLASGLDTDHAGRYADAMAADGTLAAVLRWYQAAALPGGMQSVGRVAVPTLLVWGSADASMDRVAVEGSAVDVDGPFRFVPLEGRSHWLPERHAPDVLPPLLEHLA
jgi:pimeloyl-ACP methyl ester carboxylesterase